MIRLIIKYKDGYYENFKVKRFFIEGFRIRIETKDKIKYLDYAEVENIEVIG